MLAACRWHGLEQCNNSVLKFYTFRGSRGASFVGQMRVPKQYCSAKFRTKKLCDATKAAMCCVARPKNNLKYRLPVKTGSHNGVHLNSDCNYTLARRANINQHIMQRRKFIQSGAMGLTGLLLAKSAGAASFSVNKAAQNIDMQLYTIW